MDFDWFGKIYENDTTFYGIQELQKKDKEKEKEFVRKQSDGYPVSLTKAKSIERVIFEKEYCIIVDNFGNKYIAKPERKEKYDPEKGFLVALAKYNGFTTTRVQELIKSAVVKDGKSKKAAKKN